MKYKAEDGYEIVSNKSNPVQYSCPSVYADGIYESFETKGAPTIIGIEQIKIVRSIDNGICAYTITESTDLELQQYLDNLKINTDGSQY